MIMVGANSVLTTKVIRENTRKRFTEVAVAVEEIGNSMTLTLKALAEGKQDIEHLASEVEVSVDNGTEVTEKTGKGINKHYTVNLISTYDHICVIMKSNLIRKLDNHYWI